MNDKRERELFVKLIKNTLKNYGTRVLDEEFQNEVLKELRTKDENKDDIIFEIEGVTVFNALPYKNKTKCSAKQAKGGLVFEKFYKKGLKRVLKDASPQHQISKGLENVSADLYFLYEEGRKKGEFFNVVNEPYIFVSVKRK